MNRLTAGIVFAGLLSSIAACEGKVGVPPLPTSASCDLAINPTAQPVPRDGGSFRTTLTGTCAWTATTNESWIAIGTAQGSGTGSVTYTVQPNTGDDIRQGRVRISELDLLVTQAGEASPIPPSPAPSPAPAPAPSPVPVPNPIPGPPSPIPDPGACPASVEPGSVRVKASGETVNFAVSASADCRWSVSTGTSWIAINTRSGAGSATGAFVVTANDGSARSGDLNVGGRTISVSQDPASPAAPCPTSVEPRSVRLTPAAQEVAFSVSAAADCKWSVTGTDVSWIGIPTGSVAGSGASRFGVKANDGPAARSGSVRIGGLAIAVTQDPAPPPAACPTSVEPRSVRLTAAAQEVAFSVSASPDCNWSVTGTDVPWIGIPTGSLAGSGTSKFGVKANDGSARSGSVRIGALTIAVTQDPAAPPPPCPISVEPRSARLTAAAQDVAFSITAAPDCKWSVTTDVGWIGVPTGSFAGTGRSTFGVKSNDGSSPRSGSVRIGGLSIAVTQDPPLTTTRCSLSVSPTSIRVPFGGIASSGFKVIVDPGCAWTVDRVPLWVRVSSSRAGTGPGEVGFTVGSNGGPSRSEAIVVNGQSFSISQDGLAVIGR